jgi:hypothetical protein
VESALVVAKAALHSNRGVHKALSALLEENERIDAEELKPWLRDLQVSAAMFDRKSFSSQRFRAEDDRGCQQDSIEVLALDHEIKFARA